MGFLEILSNLPDKINSLNRKIAEEEVDTFLRLRRNNLTWVFVVTNSNPRFITNFSESLVEVLAEKGIQSRLYNFNNFFGNYLRTGCKGIFVVADYSGDFCEPLLKLGTQDSVTCKYERSSSIISGLGVERNKSCVVNLDETYKYRC